MKIGDKKYMDRFIENGEIYISRLKRFRDIEEAERRDTHDGITHSYQPNQVNVLINEILIKGVIGPIRIDEGTANPLIYSMYGFNNSQLGTEPLFDKRCYKFGNTCAVIKDGQEFFSRIKNYCKSNKLELEGKLVDYVDFDSHHGEMGSFRKYKQWHEHQQEFRLVFDDNTSEKDKIISLGSLNDIAELFPTSEINNIIKITNNA